MKSQVDVDFIVSITIFAITLLLMAKGVGYFIAHQKTTEKSCSLALIKEGVGVKCDEYCIKVTGNVVEFAGNIDDCWYGSYKILYSNVSIEAGDGQICITGKGKVRLQFEGALARDVEAKEFIEDGPFVMGCS